MEAAVALSLCEGGGETPSLIRGLSNMTSAQKEEGVKNAPNMYRADGVDGPQEMERN